MVHGSCPGLPDFTPTLESVSDLRTHLERGIQQIIASVGTLRAPSLQFDVLHPDVCRIWVLSGSAAWMKWKDAVEAIGSAMQSFRARQGANRNTLNSIFGIPILHGPNHGLKRRASPLGLRITRLANSDHVGVATLFKADFKSRRHEVGGGYALIEDFINTFPTSCEVIYR